VLPKLKLPKLKRNDAIGVERFHKIQAEQQQNTIEKQTWV
jgi:hypothetical protein